MAKSQNDSSPLRVISHNVQGMNSQVKRKNLFRLYQTNKADVLLLQETHFPMSYNPSFLHRHYPQFFLAGTSNKTRGVAICFSKHTKFSVSDIQRDPEGRFILISGVLEGSVYTFVSYYAPNRGQVAFFQALFKAIGPNLRGKVIIGGDSNLHFDMAINDSPHARPRAKRPPKYSLKVARVLFEQGLVDIWRELHPQGKDYTHYSAPHRTYARIDHIFLAMADVQGASRAEIIDSSLSDHSMMVVSLSNTSSSKGEFRWRLNESLLNNPVHCSMLESDLANFFSDNDGHQVAPQTLWAAHKAVIRGKLIQLAARLRREHGLTIRNLSSDFQTASRNHKQNPTVDRLKALEGARLALNLALTTSSEKQIKWSGAKFYTQRDKVGSLLATKLNPKPRTVAFPKIRSTSGALTQNPAKILESFRSFYADLYASPAPVDPQKLDAFLGDLEIPSISEEDRDSLEAPIRPEEVLGVIKSLKPRSAPGPDGFSAGYYKKLGHCLVNYQTRFYNSLREGSPLARDLNAAYISVIPKEGKDLSEVGNYRPISLINVDIKILTKILANRISSFIARYIHKDQVGFIPGRQGPDQIRRAVDIASLLRSAWDGRSPQEGILFSVDLQKAFDSVHWDYLFRILKSWGFGSKFMALIGSLYSAPSAEIRLLGQYSKSFPIGRGTRQGCPLSPIVFAIAIETLAIAIRSHNDITGVRCGDKTHKCALFADDLLLFLTNPDQSLVTFLALMKEFGEVSGLQINAAKSRALNVSVTTASLRSLQQALPVAWVEESLPYLGIHLTNKIECLYSKNYPPLFRELEKDLKSWAGGRLSWLGKINAIKMNMLPKLLYLFRSLPVPVPKAQLDKFQNRIVSFIWGGKGHRLQKSVLFRKKSQGGLGLPNFWKYYQAAQLAQLSIVYSKSNKPDWVDIERQGVPLNTIDYLLWAPARSRPPVLVPSLSHSLALHDSLRPYDTLFSHIKPMSHLFHNPAFIPGENIQAFKWWLNKGLFRIGHFCSPKGPLTREFCINKLDMPASEFFRFHQIRRFLLSIWPTGSLPGFLTHYEQWCDSCESQKGGISIIYSALIDSKQAPEFVGAWEGDLGVQMEAEDWFGLHEGAFKGFLNIALIESNVKLLTRWYYVPARLAKFYPAASPTCFRGCGMTGDFFHTWWSCPRIRSFWNKIFNLIRKVSNIGIPQTPGIGLLTFGLPAASKRSKKLIAFMLIGARMTLARAWKKSSVSFQAAKRKISWIMTQEQVAAKLLDSLTSFEAIWEPWASYHNISLVPGT